MKLPRITPVGLLEYPEGYRVSPRRYSARLRLAAAVVLGAFAAVSVATTVYSLGIYCLTSHAAVPFGFGL